MTQVPQELGQLWRPITISQADSFWSSHTLEHSTCVSQSQNKFRWISSKDLGNSKTDKQKDGQMDKGNNNIPMALQKHEDKIYQVF